jgi:tetratricopeptide (TPR) repeat protein
MELKQLFERGLMARSNLTGKIVMSLTGQAQQQMNLVMRQRAIPEELLDGNPMSAIEECFFIPNAGAASYLMGGLLLIGCRHLAIDSEPSPFLASLYAIREAFAFFHAGQPEAANSSLRWARPVFEQLEPDLDRPQSEVIGQCLSATAHAAEEAGQFDDCLSLWREALRFLSPSGDERANCHFCIGRELERRGQLQDAMRSYHAALETPEVRDATLTKIVKMSLSTVRTQLESDPKQLRMDDDLPSEFGASNEFPQAMQQILRLLASGQPVPDDDLLKGIAAIREWVDWREAQGLKDGRSLSMVVVALKMCLSLKNQTKLPVPYLDLLLQCERYLPVSDDSTRLEYEMIRDHVLSRASFKTRMQFEMRNSGGLT